MNDLRFTPDLRAKIAEAAAPPSISCRNRLSPGSEGGCEYRRQRK
jgi:hypothetical protein